MRSALRHEGAKERILNQGNPHFLLGVEKRSAEGRWDDSNDGKRTIVQVNGTSGDPAKRPRHRSSPRSATGGAPRLPSAGEKIRPASGFTSRSAKSSGVTTDVFTTVGSPPPVSVSWWATIPASSLKT